MKHRSLSRAAALLLALVLAGGLTACGGEPQGSSLQLGTTKTDPNSAAHTFSEEAQQALDDLRARQNGELFAAAYLGYREEGDTSDLTAWLHNEVPALAASMPFLPEIPEENIIGDHGDLYCIVPLDAAADLTVDRVAWTTSGNGSAPEFTEELYRSESAEPILVYANYGDWRDETDVVVRASDGGTAVEWFPLIDFETGGVNVPVDGNGADLVLDFSHLYEEDWMDIPAFSDADYDVESEPSEEYDPDAEWLPPTDMGLANTTWYSDNGWVLEFGSGNMILYQPVAGEGNATLSPYYQGSWWMEGDSLCLGVYDGNCPFPLLISPSGEQMVIMQADDGSVLPFFAPGQTTCGMTLSYG